MAQDREPSRLSSNTSGLIIFDCDGVLVDSEVISIAVDEIVLADLGWRIGRDEIIARFVGRSHHHFLTVVEEHIGYKLPDDWEDSYQHLYRQAMLRDLRPVAGIIDALNLVTAPSCVASNGSHEKMQFTLGLTGLLTRFEGRIFSASEVLLGKPAPDLFLHASSTLGYGPSDCVVVEDSVAGVQAALAADMNVIAYAGGVTPREQLEVFGVSVIDHMSELPQCLEEFVN